MMMYQIRRIEKEKIREKWGEYLEEWGGKLEEIRAKY